MDGCLVCIYVHALLCAWCLRTPEEGTGSPGIGDTDGCTPPHGCWELSPGLPDQQVLSRPKSCAFLISQIKLSISEIIDGKNTS